MAEEQHNVFSLTFERPFGNREAIIEHGRPDEVGDLLEQLVVFEDAARRAHVETQLLIGHCLIQMRDTLTEKPWKDFLREHWHKSDREARRYMALARGHTTQLRSPTTRTDTPISKRVRPGKPVAEMEVEIVDEIPPDARQLSPEPEPESFKEPMEPTPVTSLVERQARGETLREIDQATLERLNEGTRFATPQQKPSPDMTVPADLPKITPESQATKTPEQRLADCQAYYNVLKERYREALLQLEAVKEQNAILRANEMVVREQLEHAHD
jgi:hypothetical protein